MFIVIINTRPDKIFPDSRENQFFPLQKLVG